MSKLMELADAYACIYVYRNSGTDEARAVLAAEVQRVEADNKRMREIVESAASHHCLEDDECGVCLSCRARAAIGETK